MLLAAFGGECRERLAGEPVRGLQVWRVADVTFLQPFGVHVVPGDTRVTVPEPDVHVAETGPAGIVPVPRVKPVRHRSSRSVSANHDPPSSLLVRVICAISGKPSSSKWPGPRLRTGGSNGSPAGLRSRCTNRFGRRWG